MNMEGKTKGELLAMAEALGWAAREVFLSGITANIACRRKEDEFRAAAEAMPERCLWLWRHHVNGEPLYWAFDNPFPCDANGDPLTVGEACGYAEIQPSKRGRTDISDEQVIDNIKRVFRRYKAAEAMPAQEPVAWLYQHDETGMTSLSIERWKNMRRYAEIPLYTTTPDQTAEIERLRGLLREAWQWIGPDHPLWDKDQPGTLEHLHDRIKAELGK